MADEEESIVEKVIENLRSYLQNKLSIDEEFIEGLQGQTGDLLHKSDADRIRSSLSKGGTQALGSLLDHISAYYVDETLKSFCAFLDDHSKFKKRPRLRQIAAKIRAEMKKHRQTDTQQQDGDLVSTVRGGEPVFTIDKRSQKLEEIVDLYRRGGNKVSLPRIPDLEDEFDRVIGAVSSKLSSADSQVICKLHGIMRVKYRRYIHGVKPVELPSVPNTANGLCEFITEKSTPYEIVLVHHTVEALDCEDLKKTLEGYESKLAGHLRLTLGSFKKRKVTLPLCNDHTHLAVTISKDQILLSLVLHIKEYMMKYLQLEEAVFEGFGEGCTILFFSILRIDAVLLAPKILSHSAELKRSFAITHLVVFDYFACDLETGTIELPVTSQSFERQLLLRDLKKEILHQFDQIQTTKTAHDRREVVAVFEKVQQELISTKKKLDIVEEGFVEAEKMLRTSTISWSEDKVDDDLDSDTVALVKAQTALEETTSALEGAEMKSEQLRHQLIASEMKLKLKEEELLEAKKEIDRSRASSVELAKQKDKLERSLQLSGGGTTECEDELFTLAYKDGVKDKYMCHVYEKTERHLTRSRDYIHHSRWMYTTAQLLMVITYSTIHWSQIVQKYCKPDDEDWKLRTVIQDFTVEGALIAHMPEHSGTTWSCAIDGIDQVPESSLDFTKRFPPEKDGPKLLEQAVKSSIYPPKITLMASSSVHPTTDYNRPRLIYLEIAGSSPVIRIPVKIIDQVEPGKRQPEEVSKPDSERKADEEETSSEEDFSSPSMESGKHPSPSVQRSGMTEASPKTKAATISSASSKEKEQQAN